ncbi:hypothetical protein FJ938_16615 [Mesorhizobium sp. B2-4-14]|nr:hypothetical protein FJ938_16615 [Mesorhizobium sp. B2-4-14]
MATGRNTYRFVILWRSKERSDAAQTMGSMPRTRSVASVQNAASLGRHRGMDPWVSATSLRDCFAQG